MWTLSPIRNYPRITQDSHWAQRLLNDQRIVSEYQLLPRHYDEPFHFSYGVDINIPKSVSKNKSLRSAGGLSFDPAVALMKSAGEAAERFSLIRDPGGEAEQGTFESAKPNVQLGEFRFFSREQLSTPTFQCFNWPDEEQFVWIPGNNLVTREEVKLPLQLVYMTENRKIDESTIFPATSTGAACGWNAHDSSLSAMLELLERDAFMVHYLSRTEGIRIDLRSHPLLAEIDDYVQRFNLRLQVYLLQTDFPVCPVLALLTEEYQDGSPSPWMAAGLKCSLSATRAVLGAIEEACQTRLYARTLLLEYFKNKGVMTPDMLSDSLADRAFYWNKRERIENLSFLTQSRRVVAFNEIEVPEMGSAEEGLQSLLDYCDKSGNSVYRVDITAPEIREHGLTVSRILMPTLQQFYLTEPYIPLATSRWKDVPYSLGLSELRQEPNPVPHFFL
jgi:ribosomal protein S12 methylthiotransferase accessory factor